jgi:hypothetical protein
MIENDQIDKKTAALILCKLSITRYKNLKHKTFSNLFFLFPCTLLDVLIIVALQNYL